MEPQAASFYTYNEYLRGIFGVKTYKIIVASGLTCPTRDGLLATGGCAFCDVRGSSSFYGKQGRSEEIGLQIRTRIPSIRKRFHAEKFLAYFQSYTNTYGDIEYLRTIYDAALAEPGISGICVGTRPDCLPDPVIDLLGEYAERTYVSLELGVQSFEDPTLQWLARGHDSKSSLTAMERLKDRAPGVHTCVHLMFGSPTDSATMASDAAQILNSHGVEGVKLHQVMVLERTELARRWKESPFSTVTLEEYAKLLEAFLGHLSPDCYVERLCATATHPEECLAPEWSRKRWEPHNELRRMLAESAVQQGMYLQKVPASQ